MPPGHQSLPSKILPCRFCGYALRRLRSSSGIDSNSHESLSKEVVCNQTGKLASYSNNFPVQSGANVFGPTLQGHIQVRMRITMVFDCNLRIAEIQGYQSFEIEGSIRRGAQITFSPSGNPIESNIKARVSLVPPLHGQGIFFQEGSFPPFQRSQLALQRRFQSIRSGAHSILSNLNIGHCFLHP